MTKSKVSASWFINATDTVKSIDGFVHTIFRI